MEPKQIRFPVCIIYYTDLKQYGLAIYSPEKVPGNFTSKSKKVRFTVSEVLPVLFPTESAVLLHATAEENQDRYILLKPVQHVDSRDKMTSFPAVQHSVAGLFELPPPKITILVVHTKFTEEKVVEKLEEVYGERATVYTSSNIPDDVKIDLFFLSGKKVLDYECSAHACKLIRGSKKAKVIAFSTVDMYLEDLIKRANYFGVDFILEKKPLIAPMVNKEKYQEFLLLLETILASVKK